MLYDVTPDGKTVGGAPLNVAAHAQQLGLSVRMISRVGEDADGDGILEFLRARGVDVRHVTRAPRYPTGEVRVTFPRPDDPRYEIVEGAAWDHIPVDADAAAAVRSSDALVVGTLAARSPTTRATLFNYAALAPRCVLDVNLRAPHYDRAGVRSLLERARVVKLNGEELERLAGWEEWSGGRGERLHQLRDQYALEAAVLTLGGEGAECVDADGHVALPAPRIEIVDTIGSGDAFLAAFLSRYLRGAPAAEALRLAVDTGAYVATQRGATPMP